MKTAQILTILMTGMASLPGHAQWQRKTNLPAVYINTEKNAPVTSKENYIYSTLRYVSEKDKVTTYDSTQIRGRGNSTWNLSKKPYRIKFHEKEKLLGKERANAKSWTLIANAADKTMMRNAVTSSMGEFTSLPFNPAYKFVDLILNNNYYGTYQISDQVEVRKKRVNVTEQDYPLGDNADITGGYLLEVDGWADGNYFTTKQQQVPIRIHYPDEDEIAPSQNQYISDYVGKFEQALFSNDFTDPEKGYRPYVDSLTLADWYICTEVSANIDGFYSIYFYKEQQDPHLYWGPLWDYDIAYSNDYRVQNEQHLSSTQNTLMTDIGYGKARQWFCRMWEDPWFYNLINRRYNELLDAGLVDHMNATIDSLVTLLGESQKLNYQKWGISTRMYHETVLYSSYDQYVSDLRQFISTHTAWLKTAFADKKASGPTPPFTALNYYYRITSANTQKPIEVSDGNAVTQYAEQKGREQQEWYVKPTANGHFQIINRAKQLAMNDPTSGSTTATTNVGTHLNAVAPNENSESQLWDFIPQGTKGYYNLLNVKTQHVANLQGGSNADGTAILSYTNDTRNSTSMNRLWYITSTGTPLPEDITGINTPAEPEDYALAYNPATQSLHFGSAEPQKLSFTARILTADGRQAGEFRADETFSAAHLPAGLYIVTWSAGGHQRSTKFMKR